MCCLGEGGGREEVRGGGIEGEVGPGEGGVVFEDVVAV